MIQTAEEFIKLRQSEVTEEQYRATHDPADLSVWLEIVEKYPDFKTWVIHNKTIQIEMLEVLSTDKNPDVRASVALKRKINSKIFELLSIDPDEKVRYSLMCNTKLSLDKIKSIKVDDSDWLKKQLVDRMKTASK